MDEKELQKLFEAMSKQFDVGDYSTFKTKMQTSDDRKRFYDAINKEGFDLGDYNQYETRLGGVKKKEESLPWWKRGVPDSKSGGAVGSSKTPSDGLGAIVGAAIPPKTTTTKTQPSNQPTFDEWIKGKPVIATNPIDPVKEVKKKAFEAKTRLMNISKEDDPLQLRQVAMASKDIDKNIFQDSKDATEWLYSNGKQFDPKNETDVLARNRIHEYEKTKNVINQNYGDITQTALALYADTDDRLKTLKESGKMPDTKTQGLLVQRFLNDRNVKELSQKSAEFHNIYKQEQDNFRTNYPELWDNQIIQKIAQGREDYGYNNPFLNFVSAKGSDKVIENLYMRGEIDEWDKKRYYERTRTLLKYHMKPTPTTGMVENAFQSLIHGAEGIPKGVWDLTGLDKALTAKEERAFDDLEEESDYIGVTPKGIANKISHATGNLAGVLVPMGLAAKGLTAAKLIANPKAANEFAMGITFYHDLYKEAEKNNPDGGYLNQIQAVLQSAVFAKIAPAFGELSNGIIKQTTPTIRNILGKLETEAITADAAKEQITKTVLDKIAQVGKSSVTTSSQMALAEGVNDVIGGVFSGKFDADQTAQDMASTWNHMMLGTPLLGFLHARGSKETASELLNEMANRPDYYKSQIETLAKSDPEFAKQAPELLKNLEHLLSVKTALEERVDLSPEQKKKYQLLSLKEKILTDKSSTIPDKGLKPEKELAEIEIEKKKTIGGGNKEFIEELYDEDLIPKSDRKLLENNETGKFEPNKVGEYLKFIAQQSNNLDANWKPHTTEGPKMERYPESLIEEANTRWAKEIEASKPKEETVTIDQNRELDLGEGQGVVGEIKGETGVVTTPTESKQPPSISNQEKAKRLIFQAEMNEYTAERTEDGKDKSRLLENAKKQREEAESLSKQPPSIVSENKWYRGVNENNKDQGDKFFSADESVSGDYAISKVGDKPQMTEISKDELPSKPLVVGTKEDLAETIGFPEENIFDLDGKFDKAAKKYAQENGYDGIVYESGSFDAPEMHVFEKPKPQSKEASPPSIEEVSGENVKVFRGSKGGKGEARFGTWYSGSKKQAEVFAKEGGEGEVSEHTIDISKVLKTELANTNTYTPEEYSKALGISEKEIIEAIQLPYDQNRFSKGITKAHEVFENEGIQKLLKDKGHTGIEAIEKHGVATTKKSYLIFPLKNEQAINKEGATEDVKPVPPTEKASTEVAPNKDSGTAEPPKPPTEKPAVEGEGEVGGITHAANEVRRADRKLPEYEKEPQSFEAWNNEAEQKIKDGYDVEKLMDKIAEGHDPTPVENAIRKIYIATLDAEIAKNPTDALLAKQKRFIEIGDLANSRAGRNLVSLKGEGSPLSTISDFYVAKMEAAGVDKLTETQKAETKEAFDNVQKADADADAKLKIFEEENARLKAENELLKQKKATHKTSKTDWAQQRKDAVAGAREALRKLRSGESGLSAVPLPGIRELIAIAPHVKNYVQSLLGEATYELKQVVSKAYEEFKDILGGITEKDIHDIIAGEYNEKRSTRNELAAKMRDLKDEAYYINKLDRLLKGEEPKSESKKVERNRQITELQKKIKEFQKSERDAAKEPKEEVDADVKKMEAIRKRNETEAATIKERIAKGDFETKKKVSLLDDPELKKKFPKEYEAAVDAIIKREEARHEFEIALLRDQMARRGFGEKASDILDKSVGTAKAIVTGIDDSAVAIQTYMSMLVRPRTGSKAFVKHISHALSQKRFNRWLAVLHNSPDFKEMKEMGLDVTEPQSLKEREKEEVFSSRFSGTVKIRGKEYKLIDAPLKPFERAFTTLGNVTRVVGYRTISEKYKREGYTPEKNPELFKSLAQRLNTETGRGKQNEYVENASKIVTKGIWSPRLMAMKFNILGVSDVSSIVLSKAGTKGYYRQLHPKERAQAIYDVAKFATAVMAMSYGVALAFGGDVDTDPYSPTFLDVKLPNGKSYNFTGGFSGYMRSIFQFATGKRRKDGELVKAPRLGTAGKFFRSKTPPITSSILSIANEKDFMGRPTSAKKELLNVLTPISVRNISEQLKKDGVESLFTQGIPTFFGLNVKNEKDYEKKNSRPTPPKPKIKRPEVKRPKFERSEPE